MNFCRNTSFCFFILILFANCNTSKYTPDTFPIKQIIFGDGGGFAGIETSYTLLENGQLFRTTDKVKGQEELEHIKKKSAIDFFEKLDALRLHKLDIEHPGNLYYFLRFTNEELDHKIIWGAGDYNIRKDIIDFYKSLKALTKDRKVIKSHTPKKEGEGDEEEEEG